jgi:hypothetical protein
MILWTSMVAVLLLWIISLHQNLRVETDRAISQGEKSTNYGTVIDWAGPVTLLLLPFIIFFIAGLAYSIIR